MTTHRTTRRPSTGGIFDHQGSNPAPADPPVQHGHTIMRAMVDEQNLLQWIQVNDRSRMPPLLRGHYQAGRGQHLAEWLTAHALPMREPLSAALRQARITGAVVMWRTASVYIRNEDRIFRIVPHRKRKGWLDVAVICAVSVEVRRDSRDDDADDRQVMGT